MLQQLNVVYSKHQKTAIIAQECIEWSHWFWINKSFHSTSIWSQPGVEKNSIPKRNVRTERNVRSNLQKVSIFLTKWKQKHNIWKDICSQTRSASSQETKTFICIMTWQHIDRMIYVHKLKKIIYKTIISAKLLVKTHSTTTTTTTIQWTNDRENISIQ